MYKRQPKRPPAQVGFAVRFHLHPDVQVSPVAQVSGLAFDHDRIVALAMERLRAEYRYAPDPRGLLDEPFTLLELQRLHEAVFGRDLPKDSFRRGMEPNLRDTGRTQAGVVGKPARLFLRSSRGRQRPSE